MEQHEITDLRNWQWLKYDYLIVGSGLYGAMFALYGDEKRGKTCLVIDKRPADWEVIFTVRMWQASMSTNTVLISSILPVKGYGTLSIRSWSLTGIRILR
jgi:hypothetical protein